MKKASPVSHQQPFTPETEADYDLLLRGREHEGGESEYAANIVRHYVKPDTHGKVGLTASNKRRQELLNYAVHGKLGLGDEKAKDMAAIERPCQELWERSRLT